jgi:hypothetical protein
MVLIYECVSIIERLLIIIIIIYYLYIKYDDDMNDCKYYLFKMLF